jgi:peptidoglycan/LPS O-acetylase OafA/YrhL
MLIEASLSVRELTLTYSSGLITGRFHNGPTWYISAMILGMFILYPILRKYYDTFSKVIAPFFALFIYAFLQHQHKSINLSSHFGEIMCLGFLRGVCALSIGIFIFQLVRKATNSKITLNVAGKGVLLIFEFLIVAYLLLITFHKRFSSHEFQYFAVILQGVLVFILFYNPVKISNKFIINVCKKLGELSLYIYLNHRIWTRVLETAVVDEGWGRKQLLVVYFGLTAVSVIVSWVISFVLEKFKPNFFSLLKKIFTKKETATEK